MIRLTDPNLEDKIAQVEGEEWRRHHQGWERHSDQSYTIASARALLVKTVEERLFSATIYGLGGYHRYHVHGNSVVFSVHHAGYSVDACGRALLAGFALNWPQELVGKLLLWATREVFLADAVTQEFDKAVQSEPGSEHWLLLFDAHWYYGIGYTAEGKRRLRVYGPVDEYRSPR